MRRLIIEENCPECGRWDPHPSEHGWYGPLRVTLDNDDFHRLLSHINYGGHICSPACAKSTLASSDNEPEETGYEWTQPMSQWTTTVYGATLSDIETAAQAEAERFGIDGPFDYDIRPHTLSQTQDGNQRVIDYEATVTSPLHT